MSERRSVSLSLTTDAPFAGAAVRAYLAAHATPGRDLIEEGENAPTVHALDVPSGVAAARVRWADIREAGGEVHIPVDLDLDVDTDATDDVDADIQAATSILRHMFDLDAQPDAIAEVLGADPIMGPLVRLRPGLRLPGARHMAEHALGTVLGQQVSIAAARTLQGRLARLFASGGGEAAESAEDSQTRFVGPPDVAAIAATPADELRSMLGLTNARAATLRTVAEALANGLDLSPGADREQLRADLIALRGIGPWSVEVMALRVLGDADAYPAGDLILKRAIGATTERQAQQIAAPWRPYRGYATQHLWAEFHAANAASALAAAAQKSQAATRRVRAVDR